MYFFLKHFPVIEQSWIHGLFIKGCESKYRQMFGNIQTETEFQNRFYFITITKK